MILRDPVEAETTRSMWGRLLTCGGLSTRLSMFRAAPRRVINPPQVDNLPHMAVWISLLIGGAFFLLLRATPDFPGGYDSYRHVKLASRLITEPREVFADPWHLAYFWPKPVDAWKV